MRKTNEMMAGTHRRHQTVAQQEPMTAYTLWYTNECGNDCEREFEALTDASALLQGQAMCRGNEGLWSCISITREDGEELDFQPF